MAPGLQFQLKRPLLAGLCCLASLCAAGGAVADMATRPGAHELGRIAVSDLTLAPLYWHLHTYRTRAEAEAAQGPRSTVVEIFDQVSLFTLAAADWHAAGGTRVAVIGPLRVRADGRCTASFMQAATAPGFKTDVHQHAGPEALFTLSGEVCVETPGGKLTGRAGAAPLLIDGDTPMQLASVGTEVRRSLVLILHDASQPWKVPAARAWTPKGLCAQPHG